MPAYEYKHRLPQRKRFPYARIILGILLVVIIVYPLVQARMMKTDEQAVYVTGLPANLKNLRIGFASDFHWGDNMNDEQLTRIVSSLNALNADVLILGGDYATDMDSAIRFFENLKPLRARLGVFGVVGDMDRKTDGESVSLLIARMNQAGVIPLVNESVRLKVGQSSLVIAGCDEPLKGFPDVKSVASQQNSSDVVIFAAHSPDLLNEMFSAKGSDGSTHWFDLALFGHTLGGKLTVFGNSLIPSLTPQLGKRYLSGWREENRAAILVSNGVGTPGLPIRVFTQPQIHLITLKSR